MTNDDFIQQVQPNTESGHPGHGCGESAGYCIGYGAGAGRGAEGGSGTGYGKRTGVASNTGTIYKKAAGKMPPFRVAYESCRL